MSAATRILTNAELTEALLVATKQRDHGRTLGTSDWGLWQHEVNRLEAELARRVARIDRTINKPIRSRRLERLVLWRIIKDGLRAGYSISLHDGEEWVITGSKDRRAILDACLSVDEESMRFRDEYGVSAGSVFLVYGNSGWDCICDYSGTAAMDSLLTPIMDWAEELDARTLKPNGAMIHCGETEL